MATDVEYADRALLIGETLVVADLHVGRDTASNVELPLGERADLRERLDALLARFEPGELAIAGDLLHSFGCVPEGVPETVADVEDAAADAGADLVVTPGNHDGLLEGVTDARHAAEHRVGETVVCHGHERPAADATRYVIGHEHPAIEIEGTRRPCFLRGPYDGSEVVVVPAFSRLAGGTAVNGLRAADALSPLLANLDAFRPVVPVDGDALEFPPLGKLRSRL